MRHVILPFIYAVLLITFISVGCSGGPVVPGTDSGTDLSLPRSTSSGDVHHCLGYYTLVIDTENPSLDVLHARSGELHLNVVNVLNTTMGVSAVGVPSEHDPATGLFVFDITLTHPFGTKPQLAGFDVKGILMTPGSLSITPLVFAGLDETRLENADGYSRWWNPTEFTAPGLFGYTDGVLANASSLSLTATINPYKYFADSLGAEDLMSPVYIAAMDDDNGRGVFTAGSSNTRRYSIRFPMDPGPQVVFGYAVDASWNTPSPNPPTEIPDNFPIDANQPEAYYVAVGELVNTLYYDTETGNAGGYLRLLVNVHDWQGQQAGNIAGEVDVVELFSPDLWSGAASAVLYNETTVKAQYVADMYDILDPKGVGEALVAVRAGCAGDETYDQGLGPAPGGGISAWNVVSVEIVDPECTEDGNNYLNQAQWMDFGDFVTGSVCLTVDMTDYYYFNVPVNHAATGEINFYSDAAPTKITLYDSSQSILVEKTATGMSTISLDSLELLPGNYFIGIDADPTDVVQPYFLELDGDLVDVTPCGAVDVTPSTLSVDPYHVWMHGDYAYLRGRLGVWVYDISDPSNPVQTVYVEHPAHDYGSYGSVWAVFRYPWAYGVRRDETWPEYQLYAIDFSDPYAPVIHDDVVHIPTKAGEAMCLDDELLFVKTGINFPLEILIYDIATDPSAPVEIGQIDCMYEPEVLGLMELPTYGKYLAVGASGYIHAYSVEDTGSITELPEFNLTQTRPNGLASDGDWLFLAATDTSWNGYIATLQLDPLLPGYTWGDGYDVPGQSYNIVIDGSYAYVADGDAGLSVVDISNPASMVPGYSLEMISDSADLYKLGSTLCAVPVNAGLEFFDMTDPENPQQYGHLPVCNAPVAATLLGDYMYVVDELHDGGTLMTIDVSDPANAFIAAELPVPGEYFRLAGYGSRLAVSFISQSTHKWVLLNADDPLNLVDLATVPVAVQIGALAINADGVYVGSQVPDISAWDYSSLPPTSLGGTGLTYQPYEIAFGSGHMYVSTEGGVEILSMVDPLSPVYEGIYLVYDSFRDAAITGDYLYMVNNTTVEVANLFDPAIPVFEGSVALNPGYSLGNIVIDGQYAFAAGSWIPPIAVQRLPIASPSVMCSLNSNDSYTTVELIAGNGYLYEFGYESGIHIYDLY